MAADAVTVFVARITNPGTLKLDVFVVVINNTADGFCLAWVKTDRYRFFVSI